MAALPATKENVEKRFNLILQYNYIVYIIHSGLFDG